MRYTNTNNVQNWWIKKKHTHANLKAQAITTKYIFTFVVTIYCLIQDEGLCFGILQRCCWRLMQIIDRNRRQNIHARSVRRCRKIRENPTNQKKQAKEQKTPFRSRGFYWFTASDTRWRQARTLRQKERCRPSEATSAIAHCGDIHTTNSFAFDVGSDLQTVCTLFWCSF